jgi:hypothetical protein
VTAHFEARVLFERYPVVSVVLGLAAGALVCGLALPSAGPVALAAFCAAGGICGISVGIGLATLVARSESARHEPLNPAQPIRSAADQPGQCLLPDVEPTERRFTNRIRGERDDRSPQGKPSQGVRSLGP